MNSTSASGKQRAEKTTVSLNNAEPRPSFAFARRPMADHESVSDAVCFKIKIPTEIFLAWLLVRFRTLFEEFGDQPLGQIIAETTGIDKIILWLSHVE